MEPLLKAIKSLSERIPESTAEYMFARPFWHPFKIAAKTLLSLNNYYFIKYEKPAYEAEKQMWEKKRLAHEATQQKSMEEIERLNAAIEVAMAHLENPYKIN